MSSQPVQPQPGAEPRALLAGLGITMPEHLTAEMDADLALARSIAQRLGQLDLGETEPALALRWPHSLTKEERA